MEDVRKEGPGFNAVISDPGELRPDTRGATGLADAGGQREKFPSRKAVRGGLAALALTGGVTAGCKALQRLRPESQPTVVRVNYDPTATPEKPRVAIPETIFYGKEPMYAKGVLAARGMGGGEEFSEAIRAHAEGIERIKKLIDAEAFKERGTKPSLWTRFLNPAKGVMIGFGGEGGGEVSAVVMPGVDEGVATAAYLVTDERIAPLTEGKMEYLVFSGCNLEVVMEGGQPVEDLMQLKERKTGRDFGVYEIKSSDALGMVVEVREAKKSPDGEYLRDAEGNYVFEGEPGKALVFITGSAEGGESVVIMRGELYPVEGKLKEGIKVQMDCARMVCIFIKDGETQPVTYNPFTGEWAGGVREDVVEDEKEEIRAPQIEGLEAVMTKGGVINYYAKAGNQWGFKEGTIVGHVTSFNVAEDISPSEEVTTKGEKRAGIVLHPSIVKSLFLQANTAEALAKGEWKIPLPFVGAEGYTIMEVNHGSTTTIEVKDIPGEILGGLRIVMPYPENESAFRFTKISPSGEKYYGVSIQPASSMVPDKGNNWSVSFNYGKGNTPLSNYKQKIEYNSLMVSAISGNLPAPPYSRGIQLSITAGSLDGPRDVGLTNLLQIEGYIVSMME